jgi:hypothetical protein
VRRFTKLKNSPVFNLPPPTSPCTRRMQAASAVGLSLVTSSACRLDKSAPVAAAAYALVTAAVKDGCSFASAVAASTQFGEWGGRANQACYKRYGTVVVLAPGSKVKLVTMA